MLTNIPLSTGLSLAALTPADQPVIMALMQRIYPPAYHHFWPDGGQWYLTSLYNLNNFAQELAEPNTEYRAIQYQEEPVGIVRVVDGKPLPEQPDRGASKLHRLYLDQRVQGRGVGRQVLDWVMTGRRAQDRELLWLDVMERAPGARRFYERAGFAEAAYVQLDLPLLYPAMRGMYRMAVSL